MSAASNDAPIGVGFLAAVAEAEQATPLPPPDAAGFATAAAARGAAVSRVVSNWFADAPDVLLQELLDRPREEMPLFKPAIGPVIVMRHDHVIECLSRPDLFSVDPYAAAMARAVDDRTKNPQALSHFMLGTDRDELYRLDDLILRRVVSRSDELVVTALARREAELWAARRSADAPDEIDVVPTLGAFVPLRIIAGYLGIVFSDRGEPSPLPGLRGGDRFAPGGELTRVFSFSRITDGVVPTADDLFDWIKAAFHDSFNNFHREDPRFAQGREQGLVATEYLTAYIHALLRFDQDELGAGRPVPDTMLTRLLRLQRAAAGDERAALEQEFSARLGATLRDGELAARLTDSRIRLNVFGAAVGALMNPQEATARGVDAMLRLKDGGFEVVNGSTYERAVAAAAGDPDAADQAAQLETLRRYALEGLRLQPQAEVLLRLCVKDNTALGNVPIRAGTFVIVAHAAAMRDRAAVPKPLAFDITRDEQLVAYLGDGDRSREAPQSQLYLQHGFGRHKCLGRYASEITLRESLRALLRAGDLERRGPLEMDERQQYALHLRVGIRPSEVRRSTP